MIKLFGTRSDGQEVLIATCNSRFSNWPYLDENNKRLLKIYPKGIRVEHDEETE